MATGIYKRKSDHPDYYTPKMMKPRFKKRVQYLSNGCWLWIGDSRHSQGYGRFIIGHNNKRAFAHRVAYELWRGPIPTDMVIDHLCRNRQCVNPKHLEVTTQRTNILRGTGASARNNVKTHCLQGHEYNFENTYLTAAGWRVCKCCTLTKQKQNRTKIAATQHQEHER